MDMATKKARREWPYRTAVSLLLLIGLLMSIYPIAATWYNDYHARQFADRAVQSQSSASNRDWLRKAAEYNSRLTGASLQDPWNGTDKSTNSPAWKDYASQLAESDTMARIRIPSINSELPIMHGTSDDVLSHAAGHMFGTSLPIGGQSTHAAVAAHRGLANITAFDHLPDLKNGDRFFIDVYGETLAYQVDDIRVVNPDDLSSLAIERGKDEVTLITCTPYGVNSHRLLVTGHRVPITPSMTDAKWHPGWAPSIQSWMYPRFGISLLCLVMWVWCLTKWWREDRKRAARRASSTS